MLASYHVQVFNLNALVHDNVIAASLAEHFFCLLALKAQLGPEKSCIRLDKISGHIR